MDGMAMTGGSVFGLVVLAVIVVFMIWRVRKDNATPTPTSPSNTTPGPKKNLDPNQVP